MIVIDVGNTNIVVGFYKKNKIIKIKRLNTQKKLNVAQKEINKLPSILFERYTRFYSKYTFDTIFHAFTNRYKINIKFIKMKI